MNETDDHRDRRRHDDLHDGSYDDRVHEARVFDDTDDDEPWPAPRLRAVPAGEYRSQGSLGTEPDDDPAFATAGEHEAIGLLRAAIDLVATAPKLPLSSTVRVEPDELLDLLETALDRLPDELRQARWLLKERDEFLAKVQHEADALLDEARARAEQMVQRTEIARQARVTAQRILDDAEAESRRMRHETEDYIDQKLAQFEIVVGRVMDQIQRGRDRLRVAPLPEGRPGEVGHLDEADATGSFFDQDESDLF